MWTWLGPLLALAVVIYLGFWIRNIVRAVHSGELEKRLKGSGNANMEEAFRELANEQRELANTEPDPAPDKPALRGRYSDWIAIKSSDLQKVIDALDLEDTIPCNWESASSIVSSHFNKKIFIGAPVDGWVLLFGPLPEPEMDSPQGDLWEFLIDLSKTFGDAQYYFFNSTVMVNSWARAMNGEMIRAYSFWAHEDEPTIVWNHGAITEGEREADMVFGESGYKGTVSHDEIEDHPDCCLFEEANCLIAQEWSIDPESLYGRDDLEPSVGVIAKLKSLKLNEAA